MKSPGRSESIPSERIGDDQRRDPLGKGVKNSLGAWQTTQERVDLTLLRLINLHEGERRELWHLGEQCRSHEEGKNEREQVGQTCGVTIEICSSLVRANTASARPSRSTLT